MSCSCGSSNSPTTHAGSQWYQRYDWLNDPLPGNIEQFMSTIIAAGFGPINVPFLSSVTQLVGTGYNSLAAVATLPLPGVFTVDVLIGGVPQRQFLIAGIFTGAAGTTAGNDYNPVTNAKYWVQLE